MRFERRRGSLLATSIGMIAIFLTVSVGMMSYFDSATRQARQERWRNLAKEAARSGLDFVMGWAEASIEQSSHLPLDWEVADGTVIDPLVGFLGNTTVKTNFDATTQPGDVIDGNVKEYVLSVMGNYAVTFKARVQEFKESENMPRLYKIGVVGRVRRIVTQTGVPLPPSLSTDETQPTPNGKDHFLVAESAIVATLGKEATSKYAALIDTDLVRNWVPGEIVEGPVHINRGYVDQPGMSGGGLGNSTANGGMVGRSQMVLQCPGIFQPVGGVNYPIFKDEVSMTYSPAAASYHDPAVPNSPTSDYQTAVAVNAGGAGTGVENSSGFPSINMSNIFTAPQNQNAIKGSITGPVFLPTPISLPRSSRGRLATAIGLPGGVNMTSYNWFTASKDATSGNTTTLPDGVFVPTAYMMGNSANLPDYSGGNSTVPKTNVPAGGIYIRGNVEVMRMAVNGSSSYYLFQLGYGDGSDGSPRRVFMIKADRSARQITEIAYPGGNTLAQVMSVAGNDLKRMENTGSLLYGGVQDPNMLHYGLGDGASSSNYSQELWYTLSAMGGGAGTFPFNGVIFVDLSNYDGQRFGTNRLGVDVTKMPITGNILALGDLGSATAPNTKTAFNYNGSACNVGGSAPSTSPASAEYVDTEDPNDPSTPHAASKLTIISSGNVFIQNHLLLAPVPDAQRMDPDNSSGGNVVALSATRDLLGIVADKQVVVGLCAPSTATRGNYGTVVHAAIAALGDPALQPENDTVPSADFQGTPAYRGSFATEGLMQVFPTPLTEHYFVVYHPSVPWSSNTVFQTPDSRTSSGTGTWSDTYKDPTSGTPYAGYPSNPIYYQFQGTGTSVYHQDPNISGTRGRLLVFGSITEKKRGVVGVGNISFDKDFRYDHRLASIAPPLFPTSTNMVLKVSQPLSPKGLPTTPQATLSAAQAAVSGALKDLAFLSVTSQ